MPVAVGVDSGFGRERPRFVTSKIDCNADSVVTKVDEGLTKLAAYVESFARKDDTLIASAGMDQSVWINLTNISRKPDS